MVLHNRRNKLNRRKRNTLKCGPIRVDLLNEGYTLGGMKGYTKNEIEVLCAEPTVENYTFGELIRQHVYQNQLKATS